MSAWHTVKDDFERQWASTLLTFKDTLGDDPSRYKLLVFDAYAQGRVDQACADAGKGGKR